MPVVTGISEHNGWAEFVTVTVQNSLPVVLDRRRTQLRGQGVPSQPYHHEALELPLEDAERLVAQVTQSVYEHTRAALSDLRAAFGPDVVTLRMSPFEALPASLAEVLASYQLTCSADGMMYREALADCAADLGMEVHRYPRKSDQIAAAAESLGAPRETAEAFLKECGRRFGPPWTKEHRLAAASAITVLAQRTEVKL